MTNTQLTLREIFSLAEEALIASGAAAGAATSRAAQQSTAHATGTPILSVTPLPIAGPDFAGT